MILSVALVFLDDLDVSESVLKESSSNQGHGYFVCREVENFV
jgi:hypothetical protein